MHPRGLAESCRSPGTPRGAGGGFLGGLQETQVRSVCSSAQERTAVSRCVNGKWCLSAVETGFLLLCMGKLALEFVWVEKSFVPINLWTPPTPPPSPPPPVSLGKRRKAAAHSKSLTLDLGSSLCLDALLPFLCKERGDRRGARVRCL